MFSSAAWRLLCKSGLLSRIVQSRHSVLFVIVGVNKFVTVIDLVKIVGGSHVFIKVVGVFVGSAVFSL